MHLLLHLCDCVKRFGSLQNVSCFMFEAQNGKLIKLFNGTRFIPEQISKRVCDSERLRFKIDVFPEWSSQRQLFLSLLHESHNSLFATHSANIVLIGRRSKCIGRYEFLED